jgi:PKD repeat protein
MNSNLPILFNKKLLLLLVRQKCGLLAIMVCFCGSLSAQTARLSGIINRYTAVTAIDTTCPGRIRVADTSGFRPGMAILLWQMKGASISRGNNGSYGNIAALNGAGAIERNEIVGVFAQDVVLKYELQQKFDPVGLVQMVSLPKYAAATIADTLRPKPWDGTTGGLLALEVTGTLTMDAPMVADGTGFRGGEAVRVSNNNCSWLVNETAFIYSLGNWRGASKGEGIAAVVAGQELGRGPLANGGGGGNDHNSGGGGGANQTGGGIGGTNNDPANLTCDGMFPGIGGRPLVVSDFRLFPGGGGGSGHSNNNTKGSSGGHGGGVIAVWAGKIEGTRLQLSARGQAATIADGDGAGGGGAGGSIYLQVATAPAGLIANADGGNGGDTDNGAGRRCFGPGGGGSGGYLCLNAAGATAPKGGQPGRITDSANGCNGSSSGAQAGAAGLLVPFAAFPQSNIPNVFPAITGQPKAAGACSGRGTTFSVKATGDSLKLRYIWERNTGGGWTTIAETPEMQGTQTATLRLLTTDSTQNGHRFRARVVLPGCFEEASAEAALTVRPGAQASIQVAQNGATVTLTAQVRNALSWQWSFGDGRTSTAPNPQHRYAAGGRYTVTLRAFSACDTAIATQEINIILPPDATFTIKDTLGCERAKVRFENRSVGTGTTWAWEFPQGTPPSANIASPVVEYGQSGRFSARLIVRNEGGADTLLRNFTVDLQTQPRALFSHRVSGPGNVQFTNQSTFATRHAWDFGDQSPTVEVLNPVHRYAVGGMYTVTLVADNSCGAAVFQREITVPTFVVAASERAYVAPQVLIYPNPTTGQLVIDSQQGGTAPTLIRLFDAAGRETMRSHGALPLVTEWHIEGLPAGIYRIEAQYPGGQVVRAIAKY